MLKKILKALIALAVIALLVLLVMKKMQKKQTVQYAQAVALPVVTTEAPETGDIRLTTQVIGKIEPSDVVYVYPKTSGDITAVYVKAGETVQQGDVICTIDTKQVENAMNSRDSAELDLKMAKDELARQQILYSGGGLSDQAYATYQNQVRSAELRLNQAQFNYDTQLEYSEIKAPISGLVETCDAEVYDTVNQNNQICVISGLGKRMVSFSTTERIRGYIHEGDPIEVWKDGEEFRGRISEISMMANESTGLYKVKADVTTRGMLATGSRVKLDHHERGDEGRPDDPDQCRIL